MKKQEFPPLGKNTNIKKCKVFHHCPIKISQFYQKKLKPNYSFSLIRQCGIDKKTEREGGEREWILSHKNKISIKNAFEKNKKNRVQQFKFE